MGVLEILCIGQKELWKYYTFVNCEIGAKYILMCVAVAIIYSLFCHVLQNQEVGGNFVDTTNYCIPHTKEKRVSWEIMKKVIYLKFFSSTI